ncbi:MAG: zinc-binding dehydrogenase [Gemmatimonadetes bacterium]|nr:zinc-binding dehydrogenase [Gemmatimonadota bacterium]
MNAAFVVAHGGPEVLRYGVRPTPAAGRGDVLVRIRAASLNHLDLWVRNGIPGLPIQFPRILGADGAGEILELGDGAAEILAALPSAGGPVRARRPLEAGARVLLNPGLSCGRCEFCARGEENLCIRYRLVGEHVDGTWAECVAVPAASVFPAPDGLSFEACAAFPLVFLTAWRMVRVRGRLAPGETVLVHGVGGGVSSAALQIALEAGARVMVTSSSDEKLARAAEIGAERGVRYDREDVALAVREWTSKRGVDLVVDSVGGPAWSTSLDAVARGGRIVTCGATAGGDPPARIQRIFWKQVDVLGSTMGNRRDFEAVLEKVSAGALAPLIDSVFPLARAGDAMARLEARAHFGKIVLGVP